MQNMKSSNPDLPTTEIAKKLGEMWQKMSSNILDHSPLYYPSNSISIVSSVRQILQCFVIMFTAKTKAVCLRFPRSLSWAGEEKQPYIQQAQVDKKRYEKESAVYRGEATADVDSGNESD